MRELNDKGASKPRVRGDEMAESPLVSIVTPVLNGAKYLELCIQNVLNQSYPNIEHIFVDGGSTDSSLELLASYHAKYPEKIRFIAEPDKGVGDAVNKGFRVARGQIYGWIDTDDLYEPNTISTVVEFFRTHPEAYFVYGGCNIIDKTGKTIRQKLVRDFDLKEAVERRHYITFCASFYRREVLEKAGFLNSLGNDLDFWLRIAKHFEMHRIKATVVNWRQHSDSISSHTGARARKIRRERLREDCALCIKYGGSILAPRCTRYYISLLAPIPRLLQPVLGWSYPLIMRILGVSFYYGDEYD